MSLNDIPELKDLKAYVIRTEKLNRTYTVFIDVIEKKFMYCIVESGSGNHMLVFKDSLDDVIYEIRMYADDIRDEFEAVIKDIVDVLLGT